MTGAPPPEPFDWSPRLRLGPVLDVEPAELLDRVAAFIARFSVFPDQHCAPTLALWYAHTHAASTSTPHPD